MDIRKALETDFVAMWPVFHEVVATGTTYIFAADTNRQAAFNYWFEDGVKSYVAEENARIVGMYRLVPNQRDRGDHVANASFMVDPGNSGKGIGRSMGVHCLHEAKRAGYTALQFNFVVSTNAGAIALWKNLGFVIVGTIPKAFKHEQLGLVDAHVMHRFLDDIEA